MLSYPSHRLNSFCSEYDSLSNRYGDFLRVNQNCPYGQLRLATKHLWLWWWWGEHEEGFMHLKKTKTHCGTLVMDRYDHVLSHVGSGGIGGIPCMGKLRKEITKSRRDQSFVFVFVFFMVPSTWTRWALLWLDPCVRGPGPALLHLYHLSVLFP